MMRSAAAICARPTRWQSARSCCCRSCRMPGKTVKTAAESGRQAGLPVPQEFEPRRDAVAAGLAGRKLDAMLVSFGANLRYLSGFTGSNGALLLLPGRSILFTDPRYTIQASQESTCEVRIAKGALLIDVVAAIKRLG